MPNAVVHIFIRYSVKPTGVSCEAARILVSILQAGEVRHREATSFAQVAGTPTAVAEA